jgi:hypothetical protein
MVFSEFIDITIESAFDLFFLPEDVRVGSRFLDMTRICFDPCHFKQPLHTLAFHEFA